MRTSASLLASDLNANPHPLEVLEGHGDGEIENELRKKISGRAFQLFENAGSLHGHETEHWLQAERETVQQVTQVRESGCWVIVNLYVPNVLAEGFRLLVSENQVLVEAEEMSVTRGDGDSLHRVSFYLAQMPGIVDPGTASAYVKNGTMTLEVKLRVPQSAPAETKTAGGR